MKSSWLIRVATRDDGPLLETFTCRRPGTARTAPCWEGEVEHFAREQVLPWALDPCAQESDPRLLLVLISATDELVGIGAHERVMLQDTESGKRISATKVEVVAIATTWQGRRISDPDGGHGPRASDVLMSAIMTDIAARVPPRDARVMAVIHQDDSRSLALCRRHGLIEELSRPHPAYRRLITGAAAGTVDG